MNTENANKKSSTILSLMTLVVAIDAVAVFGAAVSQQFLQANNSWLLMVALFISFISAMKWALGEKMTPAAGDVIALSAALFYDPTIAVAMAAINHAIVSGNLKSGFRKPLFKVSSGAVSMNAAVYSALAVVPSFGDRTVAMTTSDMVLATAISGAVYFALSTALVAAYHAIGTQGSFFAAVKQMVAMHFKHSDGRQQRRRLGEILIARGLITDNDLSKALETQQRSTSSRKRVGEILVEMGLVEERHVMAALGESFSPAFSAI
ncbi:MAG TPA: hypothetical protein VKA70_14865 [Blastocatellia bacterium]|nr:hypothetical protein [Blastocatellia bacterium]